MKLDCSSFKKAVKQLEKSLDYLNSELARKDKDIREQFRSASIQSFEYTYELGFKMLRRQLEQMLPNPGELREMNFLDIIRTAYDAGLVKEFSRYAVFRDMRNLSVHTYEPENADKVISVMGIFLDEMRYLLKELEKRNK